MVSLAVRLPSPPDVSFYFTREAEVKEIGRPRGIPPACCRGPPRSPTTAHTSPCCGPCLGRDCRAWKRFQRLLEESNPATEETPVHRAVSLLVIREEAARQTSPAEWESFRVSSEALYKTDKRPWVLISRRWSRDRAGHSRQRGRERRNAPPFAVPLVGHIPPWARLISLHLLSGLVEQQVMPSKRAVWPSPTPKIADAPSHPASLEKHTSPDRTV